MKKSCLGFLLGVLWAATPVHADPIPIQIAPVPAAAAAPACDKPFISVGKWISLEDIVQVIAEQGNFSVIVSEHANVINSGGFNMEGLTPEAALEKLASEKELVLVKLAERTYVLRSPQDQVSS